MKTHDAFQNPIKRRLLQIAKATALAVTLVTALPQQVSAEQINPPRVPANIAVPVGTSRSS